MIRNCLFFLVTIACLGGCGGLGIVDERTYSGDIVTTLTGLETASFDVSVKAREFVFLGDTGVSDEECLDQRPVDFCSASSSSTLKRITFRARGSETFNRFTVSIVNNHTETSRVMLHVRIGDEVFVNREVEVRARDRMEIGLFDDMGFADWAIPLDAD